MKKLLSLILSALIICIFTACGSSAENKQAPEEKVAAQEVQTADKILVAYFSCTGNTKKVAEEVAEILNADIFEIVPAQPYTPEDLDYNIEDCRANIEQKDSEARPKIEVDIKNFPQYKTIVIAFPIWWHEEPRIIDTFVESHNFAGKVVVPVCTSGGSEIDTAEKNLKTLCKGADIKQGKRLGIISKDEVKAWLDSLKL